MGPEEKLKVVLILLLVFTVFPLPVSFKKATCIWSLNDHKINRLLSQITFYELFVWAFVIKID